MKKSKNKSLNSISETLTQITGKTEISNLPNSPSSLDEILGESLSIYTAKSIEEYESQLSEMNQTDLQVHAYKIGLIPSHDRKLLCERLVTEFKKWFSRYNVKSSTVGVKNVEDINSRARKILREGA